MPTIPLNALRTFEAVASHMSFVRGAEALHVTPAAVSTQIRALEKRLNQSLFHRHGRQISLTEAGRKFDAVDKQVPEIRREERHGGGGVMRLTGGFAAELAHWPTWITSGERGEGFAELAQALLQVRKREWGLVMPSDQPPASSGVYEKAAHRAAFCFG